MSLTFTWKDERKNFSCSILVFFLNVVIIWSMLLCFNDKNWESFLNNWLSILAHFAKHHIDLSASLISCIYDLKCVHFICCMILFLWLLCFRYSFHAFNVSYVFHKIHSHLDFITTLKQLWFQKSLAQFDDFVKKVDFLMIFCSTLIILYTLSFIIVLSFNDLKSDSKIDVFANKHSMLLYSFSFKIIKSRVALRLFVSIALWWLKDDSISDADWFIFCTYVSWTVFSRC